MQGIMGMSIYGYSLYTRLAAIDGVGGDTQRRLSRNTVYVTCPPRHLHFDFF